MSFFGRWWKYWELNPTLFGICLWRFYHVLGPFLVPHILSTMKWLRSVIHSCQRSIFKSMVLGDNGLILLKLRSKINLYSLKFFSVVEHLITTTIQLIKNIDATKLGSLLWTNPTLWTLNSLKMTCVRNLETFEPSLFFDCWKF